MKNTLLIATVAGGLAVAPGAFAETPEGYALYTTAHASLVAGGVENPSQAQIQAEMNKMRQDGYGQGTSQVKTSVNEKVVSRDLLAPQGVSPVVTAGLPDLSGGDDHPTTLHLDGNGGTLTRDTSSGDTLTRMQGGVNWNGDIEAFLTQVHEYKLAYPDSQFFLYYGVGASRKKVNIGNLGDEQFRSWVTTHMEKVGGVYQTGDGFFVTAEVAHSSTGDAHASGVTATPTVRTQHNFYYHGSDTTQAQLMGGKSWNTGYARGGLQGGTGEKPKIAGDFSQEMNLPSGAPGYLDVRAHGEEGNNEVTIGWNLDLNTTNGKKQHHLSSQSYRMTNTQVADTATANTSSLLKPHGAISSSQAAVDIPETHQTPVENPALQQALSALSAEIAKAQKILTQESNKDHTALKVALVTAQGVLGSSTDPTAVAQATVDLQTAISADSTLENQAPTLIQSVFAVRAGQTIQLTASDSDGDAVTIAVSGDLPSGVIDLGNGKFQITQTSSTCSLHVIISDGKSSVTQKITFEAANEAPTAIHDSATTNADTPITIDVLANDTDANGDPLTITSYTQGAHGTVSQVGKKLKYTPAEGYAGLDSITYTISDGHGGVSEGTVGVDVMKPLGTIVLAFGNEPTVMTNSATFALDNTLFRELAGATITLTIDGVAHEFTGQGYSVFGLKPDTTYTYALSISGFTDRVGTLKTQAESTDTGNGGKECPPGESPNPETGACA